MATAEDAANLLALKRDYLKDCSTVPLYLDEYQNTESDERDLILRLNSEENSFLLVAEHDGQLIGNTDLNGNKRRKLFHTAMIGMGIAKGWQGQGIGAALMSEITQCAIANSHLSIVWLEVYASNPAGICIYEKAGFKECGRIPNFFHENGESIDNVRMVLTTKTAND